MAPNAKRGALRALNLSMTALLLTATVALPGAALVPGLPGGLAPQPTEARSPYAAEGALGALGVDPDPDGDGRSAAAMGQVFLVPSGHQVLAWKPCGRNVSDFAHVFDLEQLGYNPFYGTPEDDLILGYRAYDRDEEIEGRGGSDCIYGYGGNDRLHGDWRPVNPHEPGCDPNAGNDIIYGGQGDDSLTGCAGDDRLFGGPGTDNLEGDQGSDYLHSGPGLQESLNGGWSPTWDQHDGLDTLVNWADGSVLRGGGGNDQLITTASFGHLYGGRGDDTLLDTSTEGFNELVGEDGLDTAIPHPYDTCDAEIGC